jgi:hypothetical protein
MKITIGTFYFPSFYAATAWYSKHNPDLSMTKIDAMVDSKIKSKEIAIGTPKIKSNQELKLIDNRWHICEISSAETK